MTSRDIQRDFEPDEPEPDPESQEWDPETPEADAIEQRQATVFDNVPDGLDAIPLEASEGDALEQSRVVPVDEDAWEE